MNMLHTLLLVTGALTGPTQPPAFPTKFSFVVAKQGYYLEEHKQADVSKFLVKTTGGADVKAFSAVFCNSSGMFAFYSSQPGNCFYRKSPCSHHGFQSSLDFMLDDALSLVYGGINPKAKPFPRSSGEEVWVYRTVTCSNTTNLDYNVTVRQSHNATLLVGWTNGKVRVGLCVLSVLCVYVLPVFVVLYRLCVFEHFLFCVLFTLGYDIPCACARCACARCACVRVVCVVCGCLSCACTVCGFCACAYAYACACARALCVLCVCFACA